MGKHKKPRGKRRVSNEEFKRRYMIWTLVSPIILALISAGTTIAVALIRVNSSEAKTSAEYAMVQRPQRLERIKAGEAESGEPNSVMKHAVAPALGFNYLPIIIVVLIFSCVFLAARFIGRIFVRSRYELAGIDEGEKKDSG